MPDVSIMWLRAPPTVSDDDLAVLDDEERLRAAQLVTDGLRAQFVASRALVRRALASELGLAPDDVELVHRPCAICGTDHGKPEALGAAGRGITFSLSHTANVAALAIGRGCDVGLDIEAVRPMADAASVIGRFTTAPSGSMPVDVRTWLVQWVRREAYLKARGDGIASRYAEALRLPFRREEPDAWVTAPEGWFLLDLVLDASVVAAVAARPRPALFAIHSPQTTTGG